MRSDRYWLPSPESTILNQMKTFKFFWKQSFKLVRILKLMSLFEASKKAPQ